MRNKVALKYFEKLNKKVITQNIPNGYKSVWAQFSILAENNEHRLLIMNKLKENEIPSAIYYPKPLHLQTAFKKLNYKNGDFPISENISERIFSIPMHPYLKEGELDKITNIINE